MSYSSLASSVYLLCFHYSLIFHLEQKSTLRQDFSFLVTLMISGIFAWMNLPNYISIPNLPVCAYIICQIVEDVVVCIFPNVLSLLDRVDSYIHFAPVCWVAYYVMYCFFSLSTEAAFSLSLCLADPCLDAISFTYIILCDCNKCFDFFD